MENLLEKTHELVKELRQHKDWYYVQICLHNQKKHKDDTSWNWVHCVAFAKSKKEAFEKAKVWASKNKNEEQYFSYDYDNNSCQPTNDIHLYRANYIRESENLVRNGYFTK